MRWLWYIAQATLLLMPANAHAQFYTGNDLHARCQDARLLALGFVMAVADSSKAIEMANSDARLKICLPARVESSQILDITCKWLRDNPSQRHDGAYWLAYRAIQDAYPCARPR